MQFNHVVTSSEAGRTVKSVMEHELNMSNTMIKRVKLYGTLEINGEHVTVKHILSEGEHIFASYDDDTGELKKVPGIDIHYEDQYFAVLSKPSGMVTHPTHGHLDDSLLTLINQSDRPLHPVMGLDRETSGLIVVAKNGHVHKLFGEQKITKRYLAAVYGIYFPEKGCIDRSIKRREGSVMIREVCEEGDPGAHKCLTYFNTLAADEDLNISLVEFELATGRCHQIRVHSTYMGHPLVGDGLYGPLSVDNPSDKYPLAPLIDEKCPRVALHAVRLDLIHPITHEPMSFRCELPQDIAGLSLKFVDHLGSQIS